MIMKLGHLRPEAGSMISIQIQRSLSDAETAELRAAIKLLSQFWLDVLPINIFIENKDELLSETTSLAKRHILDVRLFEGAEQLERHMLILNRHFMNFLSSARSFIDLTRSRLSHEQDEQRLAKFTSLTNAAYDSSFSYRLLEAIRNIAQHSGIPLNGFSGTRDFEAIDESVYDFLFTRDVLLDNPKFKPSLRSELATMPPTFAATPHVAAYADALWNINFEMVEDALPLYHAAVQKVEGLLADIPWGQQPFVGEIDASSTEANLRMLAIPNRSIALVKGLFAVTSRRMP